MKDASVRIVVPPGALGTAVEYNCVVNTVEVLSKPGSTVIYQTLCPSGTIQQIAPSTYSIRLKGVQDWAAAGISAFLWTNHGQTARIVIQAHGASAAYAAATPGIDGTVVLLEGTYGGESGKWAEYDVELPCTVRPSLIVTTPTAELEAEADAGELTLDAAAA
jgi:hypothetical protein